MKINQIISHLNDVERRVSEMRNTAHIIGQVVAKVKMNKGCIDEHDLEIIENAATNCKQIADTIQF